MHFRATPPIGFIIIIIVKLYMNDRCVMDCKEKQLQICNSAKPFLTKLMLRM